MRAMIAAIATLALCGSAAAQTDPGATDMAPVSTDATTEGDRATMDGTLPVDASPPAGQGSAAAEADAANVGATILPSTPAESTTMGAPAATDQAPTN